MWQTAEMHKCLVHLIKKNHEVSSMHLNGFKENQRNLDFEDSRQNSKFRAIISLLHMRKNATVAKFGSEKCDLLLSKHARLSVVSCPSK